MGELEIGEIQFLGDDFAKKVESSEYPASAGSALVGDGHRLNFNRESRVNVFDGSGDEANGG